MEKQVTVIVKYQSFAQYLFNSKWFSFIKVEANSEEQAESQALAALQKLDVFRYEVDKIVKTFNIILEEK